MRWPVIARGRSRRRRWPGSCRWTMPPVSSRCAVRRCWRWRGGARWCRWRSLRRGCGSGSGGGGCGWRGGRGTGPRGRWGVGGAGRGAMVSVAEPAAVVRERIGRWGVRLAVAAVNGPAATVVSGEPGAVAELAVACAAAGVRTRAGPVDYASRAVQVQALEQEILAALAGVVPGPARIPMVSAVTGRWLDGLEAGAGYWYESLRAPVEFDRAVRVLAGSGHGVFIEVSPHPVLTAAIAATVEDTEVAGGAEAARPVVTGTLRRGDGGAARLLASLAQVHVRGVAVDWAAVLPAGQRVELPTYAFQHQRYWPQPSPVPSGDAGSLGLGAVDHPLLGAGVELAGAEGFLLTGRLSLRSQPWLADHSVSGTVLLPGTAFVEMAAWAGEAAGCGRIEELALETPLVLPADGAVQIQVVVGGPDAGGQRAVEVYARAEETAPGGAWSRHASGMVGPGGPSGADVVGDFAVWPPREAVPADIGGLYEALAAAGYGYGPAFCGLRAAWRRGEEVFAEVALPEDAAASAGSFGLHPALLDSALHAAALIGRTGPGAATSPDDEPDQVRLPFAYTGVSLYAAGASMLRVRLRRVGAGGLSLTAADSAGMPVVSVDSLMSRPVATGGLAAAGNLRDALFAQEWVPVQVSSSAALAGEWAVVGADWLGLAAGLATAGPRVRGYPGLDGVPILDARNAVRAVAGRCGTPGGRAGPAEGPAESGPSVRPRGRDGPVARMVRRNRFRRSSPAASSRAARRMLSWAYRGRSPEGCPVAFSFATA